MKHGAKLLLALALVLIFSAAAWAFTDTAGLNNAEQEALTEISGRGVVNGYPDGTFRPAAAVTRAEFAKMVCIYAGQSELKAAVSSFSDVAAAHWHYGWVGRAAEQGWINGYPEGDYRPQNTVTQQEVATVLVRLLGVNTTGFEWPNDYIKAAQEAGAFKNIVFVGAAPASRIITCQMMYNLLPAKETPKPAEEVKESTVRGIVTELKTGSVTIKDGSTKSATYTVSGNLLPDKLILGSYLELTVAGEAVIKVAESIIPKKSSAYWDVSLDGKSAVIDDKKYDLTEADIFAVSYTLNKTYSSDTFLSGGPIDRNILSLGGKLAAEMAVVIENDGGSLVAAYVVNSSVSVSGGRSDVVEGGYSNSRGSGLYFLGREAGLAMELKDSSQGTPHNGLFIHYTLKDAVINSWSPLLDIPNGLIYSTKDALKNAGEDDPYAWVGPDGRATTGPNDNDFMDNYMAQVISVGGGRGTVQLGESEGNCTSYFLAAGCLIYEVKNGEISQGSRSSIERGQRALALVSRYGDICYMFCFID